MSLHLNNGDNTEKEVDLSLYDFNKENLLRNHQDIRNNVMINSFILEKVLTKVKKSVDIEYKYSKKHFDFYALMFCLCVSLAGFVMFLMGLNDESKMNLSIMLAASGLILFSLLGMRDGLFWGDNKSKMLSETLSSHLYMCIVSTSKEKMSEDLLKLTIILSQNELVKVNQETLLGKIKDKINKEMNLQLRVKKTLNEGECAFIRLKVVEKYYKLFSRIYMRNLLKTERSDVKEIKAVIKEIKKIKDKEMETYQKIFGTKQEVKVNKVKEVNLTDDFIKNSLGESLDNFNKTLFSRLQKE